MKTLSSGLAAMALAVILPRIAGAQVISQGDGPRALFMDGHRNIFIVDYTAKAAARLPLTVDFKTAVHMSPDSSRLAVVDGSGIKVYRLDGLQPVQTWSVSGDRFSSLTWSHDGQSLSYIKEVKISETEARIEIYLWDATTGVSQRLL